MRSPRLSQGILLRSTVRSLSTPYCRFEVIEPPSGTVFLIGQPMEGDIHCPPQAAIEQSSSMPAHTNLAHRKHSAPNDRCNQPTAPGVASLDYLFDDASTTDVDSRPRGRQSLYTNVPTTVIESNNGAPPKSPRRQKSLSNFRESQDGRCIVATFEMAPEVAKQDVHISFQRNRLVITWTHNEVTEWKDNGIFNRERVQKYYNRTLPLPEGTRHEEIHAQMSKQRLLVRYPNSRCLRVDRGRNRSGEP